MRNWLAAAALSTPLIAALGAGSAAADPQMLGVVETASAVPLHCSDGECGAELTSICLQEARATPTRGYRYFAHNPQTIGLTGIRRDGSRVALAVENALKFAAARGYSAVRVSVPEEILRQHGVARVEIAVGEGLTLVPEPRAGDAAQRLTAADIERGAGVLRQTAVAVVDRDTDTAHTSQLLARMIDSLPRRGRASVEQRTGLWDDAGAPRAAALSERGVHRARVAYNRCYRRSRIGDLTLRQCLATTHDSLMQDLNEAYWAAVRAGV